MRVISGMREILVGEVFPVSAEQSGTVPTDNDGDYGADNAIDQNLGTRSWTVADSDGSVWFKVTLDQVTCVQQIVWYFSTGIADLTWSCSYTNCACEGEWCNFYSFTVYHEGAIDNLPSVSGCKYGDTVKILLKDDNSYNRFGVYEISITEKKGKITCWQ